MWNLCFNVDFIRLEIFCGTAPIDPNAEATGSGVAAPATIVYECLDGFEDSNGDDTYTRTCSGGNWDTGADSCSGQCLFSHFQCNNPTQKKHMPKQ